MTRYDDGVALMASAEVTMAVDKRGTAMVDETDNIEATMVAD